MNKIILNFLIFAAFMTVRTVTAQSTAKYSNEFLNIGVGARALGMANTQIALAEDVTATYWNPAGLLNIKTKYEGALMHSEYFAGIAQYDYAGFATPVDSLSHIGISVIRFGVDDIPDTRFLYDADGRINYDNIRFFNAADYAFLLSYARRSNLIKGLQLGANFKIIYRNVGSFANAWGFGLDVGARLQLRSWTFGVVARDVTSTFNAWTHNNSLIYDVYAQTGNEIPKNSIEITLPKLYLGLAKSFRFKEKIGFLASMDLGLTFDGERNVLIKSSVLSIDPSLGFELDYIKMIFLRTGINNIQEIKNFDGSTYKDMQLSFGLGVKVGKFTIDYALTDVGNQSEALYSNVFSLKAGF